jgi:Cu-Zn family superoxide dismutase
MVGRMTIQRVLPLVVCVSMAMACGDDSSDTGATTVADPSTSTAADTGPMMTTAMTAADGTSEGSTSTGDPPGGTTSTGDAPGTSSSGADESTTAGVVSASAMLEPRSGSNASGTAVFTWDGGATVDLVIELAGVLPPGMHGLHIHEFPDCSADDASSAGMHWNPVGMIGELGNIEIAEDGTGVFMKSDAWTIGTTDINDVVGHSIVIHADPDGGTRIACGVITLD